MTEVPVRALNQDTAGVLARVKDGEHLAVTERGRVVAHLTPDVPRPLADLVSKGRVRPPTRTGPLSAPRGPVRETDEAGALLSELRADERF